ncbi:unnamed protein product [Protopolystoma xenopodis]|uniref:Uncharacterized protein n=1 Tax=Protopolystoma xenopodis TaxID=117903 RepID=A0A3S5CLC8_9PLAT|nr:unnamed protein product [Protopolystoma xenopodis]
MSELRSLSEMKLREAESRTKRVEASLIAATRRGHPAQSTAFIKPSPHAAVVTTVNVDSAPLSFSIPESMPIVSSHSLSSFGANLSLQMANFKSPDCIDTDSGEISADIADDGTKVPSTYSKISKEISASVHSCQSGMLESQRSSIPQNRLGFGAQSPINFRPPKSQHLRVGILKVESWCCLNFVLILWYSLFTMKAE